MQGTKVLKRSKKARNTPISKGNIDNFQQTEHFDGQHRHVTAESLTAEINATGMHVAGGTVYNTLNQFTDAGFLRRVMVHNEYSLFDTNTAHHYHFYDAADDRLIDIPSDDVVLSCLPQAPVNHDITGVDVIIHVSKK